jgi:hypothetical protein
MRWGAITSALGPGPLRLCLQGYDHVDAALQPLQPTFTDQAIQDIDGVISIAPKHPGFRGGKDRLPVGSKTGEKFSLFGTQFSDSLCHDNARSELVS